jgi:hypothetical protein
MTETLSVLAKYATQKYEKFTEYCGSVSITEAKRASAYSR